MSTLVGRECWVAGANGIDLIAAERERQISAEGWTPEHDDEHSESELSLAAWAYIEHTVYEVNHDLMLNDGEPPCPWPWDAKWWKPRDPIRNLVRAGALIAAEIDRLQRERLREGDAHAE